MSFASTNGEFIPIDTEVYIIKGTDTKVDVNTFKSHPKPGHEYVKGILRSAELIEIHRHGKIMEYKVELDSGEEITFHSSTGEYYFKVNPA